jgi:hypothetical protein
MGDLFDEGRIATRVGKRLFSISSYPLHTVRVFGIITPHPLRGKIAEVEEINGANGAVSRLKVGASTVVRLGAIGIQPVVDYDFEVFVIDVAITHTADVCGETMASGQYLGAVVVIGHS